MQSALPEGKGSMAALIGLEINQVKKLIAEFLANYPECILVTMLILR